jgi:polysaccharide export outer membrane protein
MTKFYYCLVGLLIFMASCNVNKDFMFKTDVDYAYDTLMIDSTHSDFRISPNDRLNVNVYTNDGNIVFEASTTRERVIINVVEYYFVVMSDGYVELPILGRVQAAGKTITEFQDYIEELLSVQYVDPLAQVQVLNRRAIVFNGFGSAGQVVPLADNNIRLVEVLASAGGLGARANASKIKVIRKTDDGNKVYLVDLSTIDGVDQANMIIENGDVVYVESTKDRGREALVELTPVITLASSILFFTTLLFK